MQTKKTKLNKKTGNHNIEINILKIKIFNGMKYIIYKFNNAFTKM